MNWRDDHERLEDMPLTLGALIGIIVFLALMLCLVVVLITHAVS